VVKFKKKKMIRISHGTTPLKKISSVTQTSLIYFKDAKIFRCNYYTNINMSSNNKYIRLKNMYNKCTKNVYLVNVAFDKILDAWDGIKNITKGP
jgi:hypothetical protein